MAPPLPSQWAMKAPFATVFMLLMLAAAEAAASHVNPLVAPTAPWAAHIREMDAALANRNLNAAEQAWNDAYLAAAGSQLWQGMVEVGDASLRIGRAAGVRKAAEATARRAYLAALFRARQLASLDGVLRTAAAFRALGDREIVEQCLRIAEGLTKEARTAEARHRLRAFKAQLAAMKWEGR